MIFSNKPLWLNILIITSVVSLLTGYFLVLKSIVEDSKKESFEPKIEKRTGVTIKKLSGEVEHGLYEIKIDDSTTVLLYRGVESCTMIKK
jgi:hypothetical protein